MRAIMIHKQRFYQLAILFFSMASLLSTACMRVDPDHPYDPDTPYPLQAKASLLGYVLLVDEGSNTDYRNIRVTLTHQSTEQTYTVPCDADGAFVFDNIFAGDYVFNAEGKVDGKQYGSGSEEIFLTAGEILQQATPWLMTIQINTRL